jgi:adenosylcobinamide-GDP ribazoletransferase
VSGVPVAPRRPRAPLTWRDALAALTFLTRLPVGRAVTLDGDDVARAGPVFPLVGAAIGAAVGAIAAALAGPLSTLLAVAVGLAAGVLLTGALHLDALADTADALGACTGGRNRDRALEIMRDPTIGAFGAVAIGLDLLLKVAALNALVDDHRVLRFAVAAGALSRLAPVILAAALPYARHGEGAGAALTRGGRTRAAVAAGLAVAVAVAVAGVHGAELAGATLAVTAGLAVGFRRWLGGVTGDLLGAALELTETAVLVVAVALVGGR